VGLSEGFNAGAHYMQTRYANQSVTAFGHYMVAEWRDWHRVGEGFVPASFTIFLSQTSNLTDADLSGINLTGANLSGTPWSSRN
jgi:uncharacterized protein YjbI with pentapeptide repeats